MPTDCKIPPSTGLCIRDLSVPVGFSQASCYPGVPILQLHSGPQSPAQLSPGTSYIRPLVSWTPFRMGSHCCCNNSPPTEWLTTPHVYYLCFLEVRILKWVSLTGLKPGCWWGCLPSEDPKGAGREPISSLFPAPFLHLQSKRPQLSSAK